MEVHPRVLALPKSLGEGQGPGMNLPKTLVLPKTLFLPKIPTLPKILFLPNPTVSRSSPSSRFPWGIPTATAASSWPTAPSSISAATRS